MRIGAVNYLNSKPLIEALDELVPESELILDYPSRLADDLEAGHLDVALIPSIEFLRNPEYQIVTDSCVATHGPVMSVKLFSRVPMGEIKTLALDEGSRTSAALSRIMLHERCGVIPSLEPLPLEKDCEFTQADAILLIGDRAIHSPLGEFVEVWDLGEEWLKWTGLPFVFAIWATRKGTELGPIINSICRARNLGINKLEEIARREAPKLGIEFETAHEYLVKNLYFCLGAAEKNGLKLFQKLALEMGLIQERVELDFQNCTHTG